MDKVIVKVKGRQTDAVGEVSSVEMVAEGRHYFRNGKHYVLYNDEVMTGDSSSTETILKIAPDSLMLLRKGGINHEQFFALNKLSTSIYSTPYGKMQLEVKTDKINIEYGTVSGNIDVNYEMSINGTWQSKNELNIEVNVADEGVSRLN